MRARVAVLFSVLSITAGCDGGRTPDALVPANYDGWASTIESPLEYEIPGHTMDRRMIYINEIGTRLEITERNGETIHTYPEGTIILKENYPTGDSEDPAALSVMIKAPKDPRARGGWIWIAKNIAGDSERIFSDEFCFTCHQNANEQHPYGDKNPSGEFRDFVFFPWKS